MSLLAIAVIVAGTSLWWLTVGAHRRSVSQRMALLRSGDADARKQVAWSLVNDPDPRLIAWIARRLTRGEPVAGVREAYVWTLGSLRDPRNFPAIEAALDVERDGFVRAAAWLAAARADAERFLRLADQRPPATTWDRIGIAQGRLVVGDTRGVAFLLQVAADGDDLQRYVAGRALYKWLRPLLETAGRWPARCPTHGEGAWPPAFVQDVAARCRSLNLQAIADDNRRFAGRTGYLRREVARITNARNDLAGLLFGR